MYSKCNTLDINNKSLHFSLLFIALQTSYSTFKKDKEKEYIVNTRLFP